MSIRSKIGITIILSLGIVLFMGWTSVASQGQKPTWKGKIVTETGFLSALRAAEKLPTVVLQESLRIAEQPSAFFFVSPEPPLVDELGFIWVADQDQLLLFSPQGNFIRNFFKKGQGPGELTDMSGFIPERDRVLVFNRYPHKMIAFDRGGHFLQETAISISITSVRCEVSPTPPARTEKSCSRSRQKSRSGQRHRFFL